MRLVLLYRCYVSCNWAGLPQEALWRRASGKWDAADFAATEAAAATARVRILQQVGDSL